MRCRCGTVQDGEDFICKTCAYDSVDRWLPLVEQAEIQFEKTCGYDGLEKSRDLADRLKQQLSMFYAANDLADREAINRHGAATIRGFDTIEQFLKERSFLDFNNAPPQFSKHPGVPPNKRNRHSFRWWYKRYLASTEWAERRQFILVRCEHTCEGCGKNRVDEIHHLSYDNVGYEFLFELVGLCRDCHARLHGKKAP